MLGARPWGSRSSVLRAVAGLLVDAVDRHGKAALGAIMSGDFEITIKNGAQVSQGD